MTPVYNQSIESTQITDVIDEDTSSELDMSDENEDSLSDVENDVIEEEKSQQLKDNNDKEKKNDKHNKGASKQINGEKQIRYQQLNELKRKLSQPHQYSRLSHVKKAKHKNIPLHGDIAIKHKSNAEDSEQHEHMLEDIQKALQKIQQLKNKKLLESYIQSQQAQQAQTHIAQDRDAEVKQNSIFSQNKYMNNFYRGLD